MVYYHIYYYYHHPHVCSRHFQSVDVNETEARRHSCAVPLEQLLSWREKAWRVDGDKETDQRLMDEDTGDVDVVCANSEHDFSTSPELEPVAQNRIPASRINN